MGGWLCNCQWFEVFLISLNNYRGTWISLNCPFLKVPLGVWHMTKHFTLRSCHVHSSWVSGIPAVLESRFNRRLHWLTCIILLNHTKQMEMHFLTDEQEKQNKTYTRGGREKKPKAQSIVPGELIKWSEVRKNLIWPLALEPTCFTVLWLLVQRKHACSSDIFPLRWWCWPGVQSGFHIFLESRGTRNKDINIYTFRVLSKGIIERSRPCACSISVLHDLPIFQQVLLYHWRIPSQQLTL